AARVAAALRREAHRAAIPLDHVALPLRAPVGRAAREDARTDRLHAVGGAGEITAAQEAEAGVVEVVAVEVVDASVAAARLHERIEVLVLEEGVGAGLCLIAVVATDRAL